MSSHLEIIEVTYQLFCQHGDHLTLSEVATKCGIKKQSLYNYFTSKEALIQEMLTIKIGSYFDSIITFLDTIAERSTKEQLYEYGQFVIKFHENRDHLYLRRWLTMSPTFLKMEALHQVIYGYRIQYNEFLLALLNKCEETKYTDSTTIEYGINLYNTGLIGIVIGLDNPTLNSDLDAFYDRFFDTFWYVVSKNANSTQ